MKLNQVYPYLIISFIGFLLTFSGYFLQGVIESYILIAVGYIAAVLGMVGAAMEMLQINYFIKKVLKT